MSNNQEYADCLALAFEKAQELLKANEGEQALSSFKSQPSLAHELKASEGGQIVPLGKTVSEGIETLISNLSQNKYLYSILTTALLVKAVNPTQDVRIAQDNLLGGYSNRSLDERVVTPFLKDHGLTHCAASGTESGRNFERPIPYTLDYPANPRGRGNKEAFLGILHAVEREGVDPFPSLILLMALDLCNRTEEKYEYTRAEGLTIQSMTNAVIQHYQISRGNGRSRLPVLAIQAIYQCLMPEVARFEGKELRHPPNRHTANDKEGWIGDIQVDRLSDGTPFEGVEVKAGRQITNYMVRALPRKFQGASVDRYYILSTEEFYIASENIAKVDLAVKETRQATGCQIIVNGLNRSLWYYLRMLSNPNAFIDYYTELVRTDPDVKSDHRMIWSDILNELMSEVEAEY